MSISSPASPAARTAAAARCWRKWDWWAKRRAAITCTSAGNRNGTRIPRMYRENITESEILDSLDELVGRWAKEREAGEGFGDFTVRAGIIRPVLDPARDFWE
ncbi:sulfite reductase hemoprotein beta-component [Klebsiella pneumoniae]|uniref:Sulfite reductase hemoprotein beta-component n=1 Tax=Klebsiella pneumoniae TaxID=573 RepID=A0A2X3CSH6_KLEPN|nr:sulfite reductase hemoprotein beta-component [Klebsiella pneumoniae]